jgi:hypothetical protein
VVASITDAAQNTGTATQTLTINGPVPATYLPDAAIRRLNGSYVGVGIYGGTKQRVTNRLRAHTSSTTFEVRVTNRGNTTDRMQIRGTPSNRLFKVTYLASGRTVTPAVTAGTYGTRLAPGKSALLVIKVTRTKAAVIGDRRTFAVRAGSSHVLTARDTVGAVVRVTR